MCGRASEKEKCEEANEDASGDDMMWYKCHTHTRTHMQHVAHGASEIQINLVGTLVIVVIIMLANWCDRLVDVSSRISHV